MSGPSGYASGHRPYLDYINFLFENRLPMTEVRWTVLNSQNEFVVVHCAIHWQQQTFESPYYDFLQAPLQPLMDNLESSTYETFEKDPVKYAQYEEVCFRQKLHLSPMLELYLCVKACAVKIPKQLGVV